MQAQSYTGKFAEESDEEACPELPPKSFLKVSGINDRDLDVSSDEYRSPLSPCSSSEDAEICPELSPWPHVLEASGSNDKNNVSSDEYLSPLTPGSSSEDDADEIGPELPPRPPFLIASSVEDIKDNGVPRDDHPPPLPPRCPGPSDFGFPAYLVVDVADWRAVEEKAFNPFKDDDLYSEDKQDGPRNPDFSLMYSSDDRKIDVSKESPEVNERTYAYQERADRGVNEWSHADTDRPERKAGNEIPYVLMECSGNKGVNVRPKPRYPENSRLVDFIQPDETRASNELASPRSRQAVRENGDDVAKKLKEESSEDECHYEEIETPPSPSKEHRGQENAVDQKKTKLQGPSKNLGSKNTQSVTSSDARPQHAANASHQRSRSDMIISGRREEDWMDFRDIDQLFKLKKQLTDAQKQIIMTKQTIASESQKQQPPASTDLTSDHIDDAYDMDTNSVWDTNENRPHSPSMFCKPHSQRSTQVAVTSSESVSPREHRGKENALDQKKTKLRGPSKNLVFCCNGRTSKAC